MEERYFLAPAALASNVLPDDEAQHAFKVLRLTVGDEIVLIDGSGSFHKARLTALSKHGGEYAIYDSVPQSKGWPGSIHLAIAPTKNFDRMEWLAEKCTEVGFDALTFLDCHNSERRRARLDRIMKVVGAAVKQSRKAYLPAVTDITAVDSFLRADRIGAKFICHCHEDLPREELIDELAALPSDTPVTILVGPEGDFTADEVRLALSQGYHSVTLGTFRLRTETAGVMAVSMYHLSNRTKKALNAD